MNCPICQSGTTQFSTTARSSETLDLQHCFTCNFTFNPIDVSGSLTHGLLESTRLASVGLDVPTLQQDFDKGRAQAKFYSQFYDLQKTTGLSILDFGCSTGYFLYEVALYGHSVYGVELNRAKCDYVSSTLCLPCVHSLNDLDQSLQFDRIFLFYSLEYVTDFICLIRTLVNRLSVGGQLVIITPNLDDPLLTVWDSTSFRRFFFDFHSINYFSSKSLHSLMDSMEITEYSLRTVQGYSILNHLNWSLNGRPYPSDFVGADSMLQVVTNTLSQPNPNDKSLSYQISGLINNFAAAYTNLIEESSLGNQLHLTIFN